MTTNFLPTIQTGQSQKEVIANQNFIALTPAAYFSNNYQTTSGLTYGYYGGVINVSGTLTTIANGTLTLTDNALNYVEMTIAGAVSNTTSGFTAGRVPLQIVTTSGGAITLINDQRSLLSGTAFPIGAAGGDLTGTYPNPTIAANAVITAKINNSAVTTSKIANGAVTYAKIQDVANGKLLGNNSGGAAPPEEIDVGAGLQLLLSALSVAFATKSDENAASSAILACNPRDFYNNPGACKAFGSVTNSGSSATLTKAFNTTSVNRTGVGVVDVTLSINMTDTLYLVDVKQTGNVYGFDKFSITGTNTFTVSVANTSGTPIDNGFFFFVFGNCTT